MVCIYWLWYGKEIQQNIVKSKLHHFTKLYLGKWYSHELWESFKISASVFSITYLYESAFFFSLLCYMETILMNKPNIQSDLQLNLTSIEPNMKKLYFGKQDLQVRDTSQVCACKIINNIVLHTLKRDYDMLHFINV